MNRIVHFFVFSLLAFPFCYGHAQNEPVSPLIIALASGQAPYGQEAGDEEGSSVLHAPRNSMILDDVEMLSAVSHFAPSPIPSHPDPIDRGRRTAIVTVSSDDGRSHLTETLHHKKTTMRVDREALSINEIAPVIPSECIKKFKRGFISASDILGMMCGILSGGCGIISAVGVGDYVTQSSFFNPELKTRIILLAGIGAFVFKNVQNMLSVIKLRDELHLISYEKREEDIRKRLSHGDENFFSQAEIIDYIKTHNSFVTLPSHKSYMLRYILFNSMCFMESILGMMWSITAGLSASAVTSGITDKNLLGLSNQENYRTLTLILGVTTSIIIMLDKKRQSLKEYCERWIENFDRLCFYFIFMEHIPKKDLHKHVLFVPREYLTANTQDAIREAYHNAGGLALPGN